MTLEEISKYQRPMPLCFSLLPIEFVKEQKQDKYGIYKTGFFNYKGKEIFINIENGKWHLSVSAKHTLGYYEIKEIRYKFMPDDMHVAQIFPPRDEFVNLHEYCFHLHEL